MGVLNLAVLLAVSSTLFYYPVQLQPTGLFSAFASSLGPQEEVVYTVVHEGNGYEERQYPSKRWLCTQQKGGYNDGDQMSVFLRLFAYLGGENDQKRKLNMAIPVSIEYNTSSGEEIFTACFFLEEKDQLNYPTPTNQEVTIVQRPQMNIFTRKFGGYATSESAWKGEATALMDILTKAGEKIQSNIMYWNAYDAPFKFWNRRNEVWFVKE